MKPVQAIYRSLSIATLGAVLALTALPGASAQMMPELRSNIQVSGDYVRLGDLFNNPGTAQDTPLFKAPAPGTSGTVNARRLAEAARRHGVIWENPHHIRHIQIARAGTLISEAEVKDLISDMLQDRIDATAADRSFDVQFAADQSPLYVPSDKDPTAEVIGLRYSPRSGRFSAVILAPAGDPAAVRVTYTGRAVQVSEVPVLVRTIRRGSIISEHDVELRAIPVHRTDSATLLDAVDLIGMAARRTLRAGKPLNPSDIQEPEVVRKNAQITVRYESPGLSLTMQATALQSGVMGQVINIRNQQSSRTIQAKVIGPDLVAATARGTRLLAANN